MVHTLQLCSTLRGYMLLETENLVNSICPEDKHIFSMDAAGQR